MHRSTVMVVEDNPLTRKVVRVALQSEGFTVVEAENGGAALALLADLQPDLVLQDLVLPDLDGLELVKRLRALPSGEKVPILAFSAFPSKLAEARGISGAFTDYLLKPVEPSRLVSTIRTYLLPGFASPEPVGHGRRVLLVEDDPVQRKLLRLHLEPLGFTVDCAADGLDGLARAQSTPPDAIVSDVLMPHLDGFKFCLAVRQDPTLAAVPIVLTSAAYIEDADRRLAASAGANAFVVRTPDLRAVIDALLKCLDLALMAGHAELPPAEYADRVVRQLERQSGLSADLARKLAWLEAKLEILTGLAETLKREAPGEALVDEILQRALEATGAPMAVAYLLDPAGQPVMRGALRSSLADLSRLERFMARSEQLQKALAAGEGIEIPAARLGVTAQKRLAAAGVAALLVTPLVVRETAMGILVIARASGEVEDDLAFFATTIAGQVSQAIALARALTRLKSLQNISDATLAHLRLEDLLGELLKRISAAVGADTAAVLLVEGDCLAVRIAVGLQNELARAVRIPIGEGFAGRIAAQRRPLVLDEVTPANVASTALLDGVRSLLGVPLIVEGRVIGVLHVGMKRPRHFSSEDVQFVQLVADRVASDVERARLLEAETKARAASEAAQRRLAFLSKANSLLVESLDYEATLNSIVHLVVTDFADICSVDVTGEDGTVDTLALAARDQSRDALVRRLKQRALPEPHVRVEGCCIFHASEPVLYPEITDEQLVAAARDPQHLAMLRELGLTSAMVVPLKAHGRELGVIVFAARASRRFDPDDLATARELARTCALALDNARLYQESRNALALRDEFISIAAHELKTPVTSLRGYAQFMLRHIDHAGEIDPTRVRRAMVEVDRQSDRLAKLSTQLLDISRLEAGRLAITPELTDLTSLVAELVEQVRQGRGERHRIVLRAPHTLSAVIDQMRIEQVVTNLIDNAVKFSPDGQPIEIEIAEQDPAMVSIVVRDHGVGIPPLEHSRLFERFFQAHQGSHYGGLGLGLYISREIVDLHGGSIVAESPEDGGARFIVLLPRDVTAGCAWPAALK